MTEPSLSEIKKFCCNNVNCLDLEKRVEVLKFLMMNIEDDQIHESSDGIRVDIDSLSKTKLLSIYQKIKYLLEK